MTMACPTINLKLYVLWTGEAEVVVHAESLERALEKGRDLICGDIIAVVEPRAGMVTPNLGRYAEIETLEQRELRRFLAGLSDCELKTLWDLSQKVLADALA
jgi:hypothetical protein